MPYELEPTDDTGTEARIRRDYLEDAIEKGVSVEALMSQSGTIGLEDEAKFAETRRVLGLNEDGTSPPLRVGRVTIQAMGNDRFRITEPEAPDAA